ncbi:MAG: laccase domain-containing protein, partial [Rhodobacteraceae bacterium]|nr:laccase domain-containing protein [Paracoccaceae bacterium]
MPNTLDKLTDPALAPLCHGFFTRKGGASSGIFEGLNCGQGSSDQSEAVILNRERVAQTLGVAPQALIGVHQIHSADVITVTEPWVSAPKADALVT